MAKSPIAEANNVSSLLNFVLGAERFPVDVKKLALEYSRDRFPGEPISSVESLVAPGFEGMLVKHPRQSKWKIGYNDQIQSPGRIRFTLAHEFGHYMLHRTLRTDFQCTDEDMHDWDSVQRVMESEADVFASYLLMPLDDFRRQTLGQPVGIELILHCAERYGVSPMAAALKWTEIAPKRAVVLAVRDGFVLWARSNRAALMSGAYLAPKRDLIEVPAASSLYECSVEDTGASSECPARIWFPKEPQDMSLKEHIYVSAGSYGYTLAILELPDAIPRWERKDEGDDEERLASLTSPSWLSKG